MTTGNEKSKPPKPLNESFLRTIKATGKEQRYPDGGSMYLLVTPNGDSFWKWAYRYGGNHRTLSFGCYSDRTTSLVEARKERERVKQALREGRDPREIKEKAAVAADRMFRAVAQKWLDEVIEPTAEVIAASKATKRARSKSTIDREKRIIDALNKVIGYMRVETLRTVHFTPILAAYDDAGKHEMRERVQSTCSRIMSLAQRKGWIEFNPLINAFDDVDFRAPVATQRPAITDPVAFGELMRKIDAHQTETKGYLVPALRFLALTFVNPAKVMNAEWAHVDLDVAEWRVPFEQLKMRYKRDAKKALPHIIPLSRQAVALLREMQKLTSHERFVFGISSSALKKAQVKLGYQGVHCAHGFRSSASTMLGREKDRDGRWMFDAKTIDKQMDHLPSDEDTKKNPTRERYDRDDRMPERVVLMQYWADMIDRMRDGCEVVPIKFAGA